MSLKQPNRSPGLPGVSLFPARSSMEPIKHHCELDLTVFDTASTIGSCLALSLCMAGVLFLPLGFEPWVFYPLAAGVILSAARIILLTARRRVVTSQRQRMDEACAAPGRVLLLALMADGQIKECRLSDLDNVTLRDFLGKNPIRVCREVRGTLGGNDLLFLPISMNGGLLRRDSMLSVGPRYCNDTEDVRAASIG